MADKFLAWLSLPVGLSWVDIGCGTGALTGAILKQTDPSRVTSVDPSEGFLNIARDGIIDSRAVFKAGDAQDVPVADNEADAAVSGLVLNFVPDKVRALNEMCRIVKPGGTVALFVWDYAGAMQLMRYFWDAVSDSSSDGAELDEGKQFPICKPQPLENLFREAGFTAIDVVALDVPTVFEDFNDYWSPFLRGQGPAGGYCLSLTEKDRELLRNRLESTLAFAPDGRLHLVARAWAIRGRRLEN